MLGLACSSCAAELLDEHTFVTFDASVPDARGSKYPERLPEVALALESAMAARSFTWPL